MKLLSKSLKKTNAIALLISIVFVGASSLYGDTADKELGRWLRSSSNTNKLPCPGGGTWSRTSTQDEYEGGMVTYETITTCDGETITSPTDTFWNAIGGGSGGNGLPNGGRLPGSGSIVGIDGDDMCIDFGGGTFPGAPKIGARGKIDGVAVWDRGDFGTDDVEVRIFEVVNGNELVVILDTTVGANVRNIISLKGLNINENHYVSVSRGLDFTDIQNSEVKSNAYDLIADYNRKNSGDLTRKLESKTRKSYLFVSKLDVLRDKKYTPSADEMITVFPNPSRGDVNINVNAELSGDLKVYYVNQNNNEYELVQTINLENGVTSYKIDSSVLNKVGTYMVISESNYNDGAYPIAPIPFMIVK